MAVGVKVVNRPGSLAQQAYLPAIAEGLGVTFRHFVKNFFGNVTGNRKKTDIVTIYTNLPDNYAPYVDSKTEAIIEMSELPGVQIHTRITRFSPSLQTPSSDRTMRIEVDLYNRGPKPYREFVDTGRTGLAAESDLALPGRP